MFSRNLLRITLIAPLFLSVQLASIACTLNGQEVPTGTQSGPYTCCSDGVWRTSCSKP